MDLIPLSRTVIFIGDYFTLMTTVVLVDQYREDGESDEDYAVRLAGILMEEQYGWNVAAVANDVGVVDED